MSKFESVKNIVGGKAVYGVAGPGSEQPIIPQPGVHGY